LEELAQAIKDMGGKYVDLPPKKWTGLSCF
jgi:hypothetical protein